VRGVDSELRYATFEFGGGSLHGIGGAGRRRFGVCLFKSGFSKGASRVLACTFLRASCDADRSEQRRFRPGSFGQSAPDGVSAAAAAQATATGVPASLIARVIGRESGGNPRTVHAGNYGLMQIKLGTARAMGYSGSAEGLLDPQTNMTYAVRYLAGAYRAAGGDENRAVALYARGYYAEAKARGFSPYAQSGAAAAPPTVGFGAFTPVAFQMAEPLGATSVYRLRHRRHPA
jgi:soluble lytic murein transglycosylase-like protein